MTVDAPSTLPLRLADLSGSYNIQMTEAGGFTLILAWIPASAGMTEAGGFTLILAWIPASAGMTEAGASPSSSPGFQPPLE